MQTGHLQRLQQHCHSSLPCMARCLLIAPAQHLKCRSINLGALVRARSRMCLNSRAQTASHGSNRGSLQQTGSSQLSHRSMTRQRCPLGRRQMLLHHASSCLQLCHRSYRRTQSGRAWLGSRCRARSLTQSEGRQRAMQQPPGCPHQVMHPRLPAPSIAIVLTASETDHLHSSRQYLTGLL